MKRIVSLILIAMLLAAPALAGIDLSGMTFDELIELQKQVTAALWASDGWQEVTVPAGYYEVGTDIPAGRWTLSGNGVMIDIYRSLDAASTFDVTGYVDGHYLTSGDTYTANLKEGQGLELDGPVTFTPYVSALEFK